MAGKKNNERISAPVLKADWLTKLSEELNVPKAPEGWYIIAEIARALNINSSSATDLMVKMKAQKKQYTYITGDNKRMVLWHYKLEK